jgi:hypothetical protein
MRRLTGETVEELRSIQRRWPEAVTINWPPRGRDSWKSKSLPIMWIDADREDVLAELESAEVPDEYLNVLLMMIREELYRTRVGMTDEVEKFFVRETRGKLIQLLRMGAWIDQPENPGLKNLNARLEKIDLGRRSDLNFSSQQAEIQKYDVDFKVDDSGDVVFRDGDDTPDFYALYRDGSNLTRSEIIKSRPWMKDALIEQYGEP